MRFSWNQEKKDTESLLNLSMTMTVEIENLMAVKIEKLFSNAWLANNRSFTNLDTKIRYEHCFATHVLVGARGGLMARS